MKIEMMQSGLAKFIDREVVPSLSGWDKVLVGGGGGLLAAKLPQMIEKYAEHPMISALGLYQAAVPYLGTETLPIKIPLVGITIKVGRRELDSLYAYIREG